jgi:hypothetical protein
MAFVVLDGDRAATRLQHYRYGHQGHIHGEGCEHCIAGKGRKTGISRHGNPAYRAERPFQIVHMDTVGPISVKRGKRKVRVRSLEGHLYVVISTCDYSTHAYITPHRSKSTISYSVVHDLKLIERQFPMYSIKRVHTDGGTEFVNSVVTGYCKDTGIIHTQSDPYNSAHHGLAERMNGIFIQMTRSMLAQSGAPMYLWCDAMIYSVFVRNRTPRDIHEHKNISSFQLITGHPYEGPDIRVWGCDCHCYIEIKHRAKFERAFFIGMFLGISTHKYHSYKVLNPKTMSIVYSRSVQFIDELSFEVARSLPREYNNQEIIEDDYNESSSDTTLDFIVDEDTNIVPNNFTTELITESNIQPDSIVDLTDGIPEFIDSNSSRLSPIMEVSDEDGFPSIYESKYDSDHEIVDTSDQEFTETSVESIRTSRSGRTIQPVNRFGMVSPGDLSTGDRNRAFGYSYHVDLYEPPSYKQAMKCKDAPKWSKSIQDELDSLISNGVFEVVKKPPHVRLLKTRWVFKIKRDESNNPIRWKARFVAKGYDQREGLDYDDTYAPVAKFKSVRMLLSLAAHYNLKLKQLDFETAFLNAELDHVIYIELPEGFDSSIDRNVYCIKLVKALYGLKQAPRQWYITINELLNKLGYHSTISDPCIYVKQINDRRIILSLYVDDTTVAYHPQDESVWLLDKETVSKQFKITDLGDIHWLLNMLITRDSTTGTITLSQEAYADTVLHQFRMNDSKPVLYPLPVDDISDIFYTSQNIPIEYVDENTHNIYRSAVGALLYLANNTRIDLSHAVGLLSRYVSKPTKFQWSALKHVLRYLNGTKHYTLKCNVNNDSPIIESFVDADWAKSLEDRKSVTGCIVKLFGNPVVWASKRQQTVALSSCEAEYMALSYSIQEVMWCKYWIYEVLGMDVNNIVIHDDSQSAIKLIQNDIYHQRTKHIDIRHHYIRDHIVNEDIQLKYIPTTKQIADILTKSARTPQFNRLLFSLLEGVKRK